MFEIYLLIALVATFSAVMLCGLAFEASIGQRRRSTKLLEARLENVAVSLRDQDLQQSFFSRVVLPGFGGIGKVAQRLTPLGLRRRLARRIVLAGSPAGWDAEKVAAFKFVRLAIGATLGLMIGAGSGEAKTVAFGMLLGGIGYFAPDALMSGRAQRRQQAIQRARPDTMDLLTISVEAGLGFDAAMAQVV